MTSIAHNLMELIGQTPLLRLARLAAHWGWEGELLAKLEFLNPSGSDKDRVVRAMLDAAERAGTLAPHSVIIEPTSGNIAFALAVHAVPRGYHLLLVMPEGVPAARIELLRALGAEVVLTPASLGMRGAGARAELLADEYPSVFRPCQFDNPANPAAHEPCADEIWEACGGRLAALVAGVSTGGTVTGVGRRLKQRSAGQLHVVSVEPAASPVLSGGEPRDHPLHGMGPPFVPANYDPQVVDEVIGVSSRVVQETLLHLYRLEGVMSGPTGGAALAAARVLAQRPALAGQRIVVILPDSMERYADLPFWQHSPLLMPTLPDL